MKNFASSLSLMLLATIAITPALYPSQASNSCPVSSSSSSSSAQATTVQASSSSYGATSSNSSSSATTTDQAISQEIKRRTASLASTLAIVPTELITLIADYDNDTLTAEQLFGLAEKHQTGNCVEKNEKLAAELYQIAANQGYAPAQYNLAACYGHNKGVPANLTQEQRRAETVRLYTLAANPNNAEAQNNLAVCYVINTGVPANLTQEQRMTEAVRLFTLAANQNNADAQNNLAVCYEHNEGVPANLTQEQRWTEAVRLLTLAANQNNAKAQNNLARHYEHNEGIAANLTQEQRMAKAVSLYTLAAIQNYAEAQYNLAWCYVINTGVPANLTREQRRTEAVRLFTIAANQGHVQAQFKLAECYEEGANLGKALEFYGRAAEQGNQFAQITICKAFQKGLLPRTEEFQKLADSCHKQLVEKLGSEQVVREIIEEEIIRLHDGIALDCQAEECAICRKDFEPLQLITILPCYHVFCPACIQGWFDANPRHLCPTCRQPAAKSFSGTVMKKESNTKPAQAESKESKEKKS